MKWMNAGGNEMKLNIIGRIAVFLAIILTSASVNADVLYWWIKDNADDPQTTIEMLDGTTQPLSQWIKPGDDSFSVRIRANGVTYPFLQIWYDDGESESGWMDGTDGVWVGHDDYGSGYFTTGVVASNFEGYESASSFVMEIGQYLYDEATDTGGWVKTLAVSDPQTASELSRFIHPGGVAPPSDIWNPRTFHEVPEPSRGILMIFGLSLFMLRRRKMS